MLKTQSDTCTLVEFGQNDEQDDGTQETRHGRVNCTSSGFF